MKINTNPNANAAAFLGAEVLSPREQRSVKGGTYEDVHQDTDVDDGNAHIHQHVHVPAPQTPLQSV